MNRKIKNLNDLQREKELLKVRERVIHAEINGQVEKMGITILKNTLNNVLNRFKKS